MSYEGATIKKVLVRFAHPVFFIWLLRQASLPRIQIKNPALRAGLFYLCPGLDSNQHTSRRRHLKTVRLPISPPGRGGKATVNRVLAQYFFDGFLYGQQAATSPLGLVQAPSHLKIPIGKNPSMILSCNKATRIDIGQVDYVECASALLMY